MTVLVNDRQWVQPLFMVYDAMTDQQVPLTQERLDQLLAVERQYCQLISDIRRSHVGFVQFMGGSPASWGSPGSMMRADEPAQADEKK